MSATIKAAITALKNRVAAAYTWLTSKVSGNLSWGVPSLLPLEEGGVEVPQDTTNLVRYLSLLNNRKIVTECGANDNVPEGINLLHLLGNVAAGNTITELYDTDMDWNADNIQFLSFIHTLCPLTTKFVLNCTNLGDRMYYGGTNDAIDFIFPYCTTIANTRILGYNSSNASLPNSRVYLPALSALNQTTNTYTNFYVKEIYMPNLIYGIYRLDGSGSSQNTITKYMLIGCKGEKTQTTRVWSYHDDATITDIEIGDKEYIDQGLTPRWQPCMNITIGGYSASNGDISGLTEENMIEHIFKRLKQDEANCGSGVTISIGTTLLNKITSAEGVALLTSLRNTYGYTIA